MNSSVTADSAISVTSSLCLPISCSSRSKGPSKLVSRTVNRAGCPTAPLSTGTEPRRRAPLLVLAQPADEHGVLAVHLEVGQQDGDRLADDPAAVGGDAVLPAQGQPGTLQRQQFLGRAVDGDLLLVPGPALL